MSAKQPPDPLLSAVEKFLEASQMTATAFGQQALNDPAFVHELRRGRECKRATRARTYEFIREFTGAVVAASEQCLPPCCAPGGAA
jgi:2,4-dienoyl-CoA reductase-like NADH-dependent reductase (Old Yellow Enzyme family)